MCRYTIAHLSRRFLARSAFTVAAIFVLLSAPAHAQSPISTTDSGDPFAKGRWRAEFAIQAALEAWNYNTSHEELYGLAQGITYGIHKGLVVTARQRLYYVSQRRNDSRVLGLTTGLRGRFYTRGRTSAVWQFDLGISDAAIAVPNRGTRFNYLALGGGGVIVRMSPRVSLLGTLEVVHISNANLAGPDRNPDIEAIGPSVGMVIALN